MTKLKENKIYNESTIDLLVGGTPCQSFSLAGLRAGLASENGNLALEFCRILRDKRPTWFVWENVPGVFSSYSDETDGPDLEGTGPENGRDITETADFAAILAGFSECGYCCAWRVLDSKFFGVPQRRRRVFVVGHLGNDWRPPAAVLFEQESMRGGVAPGGETRETVAGTLTASAARSRGAGSEPGALTGINISFNDANGKRSDRPKGGLYINETDTANCVTAKGTGGTDTLAMEIAQTLTTSNTKNRADDSYVVMSSSQTNASVMEDEACTLTALNETPIVSGKWPADTASTLNCAYADKQGLEDQHINSGAPLFVPHAQKTVTAIRRLTPLECERLQGFPDNYTRIPGASDAGRYKALGNSMTVNVMGWIGRRIDLVQQLLTEIKAK